MNLVMLPGAVAMVRTRRRHRSAESRFAVPIAAAGPFQGDGGMRLVGLIADRGQPNRRLGHLPIHLHRERHDDRIERRIVVVVGIVVVVILEADRAAGGGGIDEAVGMIRIGGRVAPNMD